MSDLKTILDEQNIYWINTNNPIEIKIQCTSGEHSDVKPSLSYDLDKNIFHCFSCGFSGGLLKFLQSIGITQKIHIESKQEYKVLKLKRKLSNIKNSNNIELPKGKTEVYWDFNGVNKETLVDFEAFITTDYLLENYICIPIYLFKRLKCIDARRRINDTNIPKYLRTPSNISMTDLIFPIDRIKNTNHVYLVEGMYDMLNMYQHGFNNVLCIFGANNLSNKKIEILEKIGITKVTLLFDGDDAGKTAMSRATNLLEKNDILTNKVYLKNGEDPGNLTKEKLEYYLKREQNT